MNGKSVLCLLIVSALFSCFAQAPTGADPLREFEARAARFKSVVQLPKFEVLTNEVHTTVQQTISSGNKALDIIAATEPTKVTFENTVGALDNLAYQIGLAANRLAIDFESNVTKAQKAVKFTRRELEGVPEGMLEQLKTGDDEYSVMANVTVQYVNVMENAKREDTRKRLLIEHDNLARQENIPL